MKTKFQILLLAAVVGLAPAGFAQYSGGSGDGYTSSRSDDILYEGTTPIVTGAELPDIVHNLTINNSGGVTLSKNITVTNVLSVLNGDFNLNGFVVTFGENATLVETPGNIIIGGGGSITVTRILNDLTAGVNAGNLGLEIITAAQLGVTTIARGNVPQQLSPGKESRRRFFDVEPTNNTNLDATVEFHYDDSELAGIPEADLALFISHDAIGLGNNTNSPALGKSLATTAADTVPSWDFLGGTVNAASKKIEKGGVSGFSRLTIARGFVFLAEKSVEIEGNTNSAGDIHSNGDIEFDKGNPGTHTGDLTAVDDIEIDKNNVITGNAFAGDKLTLRGNAGISGTAAENAAVFAFGLPAPSFTAGTVDITVPKQGALHLDPGAYDEVEVKKGGRLFLCSGDYFMDELDTDEGAILSIDVATGPVNVNIVDKLDFDEDVQVIITPNGQAASNQVTFTTLQYHKVDIEERALILGWIIAPRAEVNFDEECRFKGSVVAKSISVEEDVIFVPHSFTLNLTKPDLAKNEEVAASNQQRATSYQLEQNYPNPFNPSTKIAFHMKEAGEVWLVIYNLQGQEVRTLLSGVKAAGQHVVTWDGKNNSGQLMPSSVYLYRLSGNGFVITKKMSRIK